MTSPEPIPSGNRAAALCFIVCLGVVSLFAGMTYEGAHSIIGPYLKDLGASAFVVAMIAGSGRNAGGKPALLFRAVCGPHPCLLGHYVRWIRNERDCCPCAGVRVELANDGGGDYCGVHRQSAEEGRRATFSFQQPPRK